MDPWGSEFRVQGLGSLGFRVLGFGAQGLGSITFRGFRVQGSGSTGFRGVLGLGDCSEGVEAAKGEASPSHAGSSSSDLMSIGPKV